MSKVKNEKDELETIITQINELLNEIKDEQKNMQKTIENNHKVNMQKFSKLLEYNKIADMTNTVFERRIARIEIEEIMEETRIMLNGLAPENYEIKRISGKLAKTLKNKTIIINPEIVKYDKQVLRYIVLREFCHLKYRTNSTKYFEMLGKYMANYGDYEYMLKVA